MFFLFQFNSRTPSSDNKFSKLKKLRGNLANSISSLCKTLVPLRYKNEINDAEVLQFAAAALNDAEGSSNLRIL